MKLYDWQQPYSNALISKLNGRTGALLVVPPGGGKTYMAMDAVAFRGTRALVFCPKSVINVWEKVSAGFGIANKVRVMNYEQLTSRSKMAKSGLLGKWRNKSSWEWSFAKDAGCDIIFDEGHRCCGRDTKTSALAMGAAAQGIPHAYLTATPPDSPLKMKAMGVSLGLFHRTQFWEWAMTHGVRKSFFHSGFEFPNQTPAQQEAAEYYLEKIGAEMFGPDGSGVRMTHAELLQFFPEGHTYVDPVSVPDVHKFYQKHAEEFAALEDAVEEAELRVVENLRIHQLIEMQKVPVFKERIKDLHEAGQSVAVFVNFRATLEKLAKEMKTTSVIIGEQTDGARAKAIDNFQSNDSNLIISTAAAGGIAISLHDLDGNHPRTSLISPVWDPVHLKQVLGRIHRAGGLTPVCQQILVLPGLEEKIYNKCLSRLQNMGTLVDDQEGFEIS